MVCGACVLFFSGADKSSVLYTGNIVGLGSVIIAAGKKVFVELNHLAAFASLFTKCFKLLFAAVNPNDFRRINKLDFFVNPSRILLLVVSADIVISPFEIRFCRFCNRHTRNYLTLLNGVN